MVGRLAPDLNPASTVRVRQDGEEAVWCDVVEVGPLAVDNVGCCRVERSDEAKEASDHGEKPNERSQIRPRITNTPSRQTNQGHKAQSPHSSYSKAAWSQQEAAGSSPHLMAGSAVEPESEPLEEVVESATLSSSQSCVVSSFCVSSSSFFWSWCVWQGPQPGSASSSVSASASSVSAESDVSQSLHCLRQPRPHSTRQPRSARERRGR